MSLFPGVVRLEGEQTFYDWHRTIRLYARVIGCHRTLEGYYPEPARRTPPGETVRGEPEYDRIRPLDQRAGDCPPGQGQCDYVGGDVLIEEMAIEFDETVGIGTADFKEWKYWSIMEAKSQALIMGTIGPAIEPVVAESWCANDMFNILKARFGTRPYLDKLRLEDDQTTPDELTSHLAEYQNRIALARSINPAYEPSTETVELFKRSLNTSIKHAIWGEWLKVPFSLRTWGYMVQLYQRIVTDMREQRQSRPTADGRFAAVPPAPVTPLPTP